MNDTGKHTSLLQQAITGVKGFLKCTVPLVFKTQKNNLGQTSLIVLLLAIEHLFHPVMNLLILLQITTPYCHFVSYSHLQGEHS